MTIDDDCDCPELGTHAPLRPRHVLHSEIITLGDHKAVTELTPAEVASRLNVSIGFVYCLCAAGKIRHSRLGPKSIRISGEAVAEYLASTERGPSVETRPRRSTVPDYVPSRRGGG